MTTRNWQRSWAPRIGHNASIGQGWTARRLAVRRIRDTELWQTQGSAVCLDSPPLPARGKRVRNWKYSIYLQAQHVRVAMDCQSYLTGIVKQRWLMRVELVRVLRGIKADVFTSHNLMYGGKYNVKNSVQKTSETDRGAVEASSPEPKSSAEGLGEEETPYLPVRTMRSQ